MRAHSPSSTPSGSRRHPRASTIWRTPAPLATHRLGQLVFSLPRGIDAFCMPCGAACTRASDDALGARKTAGAAAFVAGLWIFDVALVSARVRGKIFCALSGCCDIAHTCTHSLVIAHCTDARPQQVHPCTHCITYSTCSNVLYEPLLSVCEHSCVRTFGLVTPRLKRFTVLIISWHYK